MNTISERLKGISVGLLRAEETYPVRWEVLRKGKPIESCSFSGDSEADTYHLGARFGGEWIGVCTLLRAPGKVQPTIAHAYQLRGMAVLPEYRSLGLGGILLDCAEQYLKQKGVTYLWMNARLLAVNFYERNGYAKRGTLFEISGVGPHYYMDKLLTDGSQDIQ